MVSLNIMTFVECKKGTYATFIMPSSEREKKNGGWGAGGSRQVLNLGSLVNHQHAKGNLKPLDYHFHLSNKTC